jgi:hypothetical protein
MHNTLLYNTLATYGSQIKLAGYIDGPKFIDWTEEKFDYVRYNPRKTIDRWGLSITSLDGSVSGIPDLDSLHEYNTDNNTQYEEQDFKTPTEVYYRSKGIQKFLKPFDGYFFRTHILKLNPGGYFPKHRDFRSAEINSFRLIAPLKNPCTFLLEDRVLEWEVGALYFLDTAKVHQLFNSTFDPSYWLVVNVELNDYTFDAVVKNFIYK